MPHLFDFHAGSERLAVWRSDADGQRKLEIRTLNGQAPGEVPAWFLPLSPQWSPDGSTIAFGSNDGLIYIYRPGETSPTVVFGDPALDAGFCQWSGDGKRLVFSAYDRVRRTPPDIYWMALDTGRAHLLTNDGKTVDRFPHWSPSGQWVAFQRQILDDPDLIRRVYLVEAASGRSFPVLPDFDGDFDTGRHCWSPDSASLLVTLPNKHPRELRVVRIRDQATSWRYASKTIRGGAFSPAGDRILCVCEDELLWFAYPQGNLLERLSLASSSPVRIYFTGPQIAFGPQANSIFYLGADASLYRWDIGGEHTCILADNPPDRPAFTREAYTVPSRDGRLIPVLRFIPPQPRRAAVMYVHGGPGEAINPDDPFMLRLLAEGVEFVCAGYRGSSGYGPEHAEANRGEYGRADVWDILAVGSDWKKRLGENRPLILTGYSYGGFLTLLALARDDPPWAGGIALWAVADMSHLGLHRHHAFPTGADEQAAALVERSPLKQAGRIRVPLLIFHGALDSVATTGEMKTIQASVAGQGVQCDLFVYEDDTHGLMRHRDEIHAHILSFLKQLEG